MGGWKNNKNPVVSLDLDLDLDFDLGFVNILFFFLTLPLSEVIFGENNTDRYLKVIYFMYGLMYTCSPTL